MLVKVIIGKSSSDIDDSHGDYIQFSCKNWNITG